MKKFFKLFAGLLAVSVFALGMVSCSNGSSGGNDDADGAVAVFEGTYTYPKDESGTETGTGTCTIYCYEDGTYVSKMSAEGITVVDEKGTFSLSKEDNKIKITITATEELDEDSMELVLITNPSPTSTYIINNEFSIYGITFSLKSGSISVADDSEDDSGSGSGSSTTVDTSLVGSYKTTSAKMGGVEGVDQSNYLTLILGAITSGSGTAALTPNGTKMATLLGTGTYSLSGTTITVNLTLSVSGGNITLTGTVSGTTITFPTQTFGETTISATFVK